METMEASSLEKVRSMGQLERYFGMLHYEKFYLNAGASGYYTIADSTSIKSAIFSALSVVVAQHSILSVFPVDAHTTKPYYVRIPQIDLTKVVRFVTRETPYTGNGRDIELDELLEAEHNTPFGSSSEILPFWRLIITTANENDPDSFVASFIYYHASCDGISGKAFHSAFLRALEAGIGHLDNTTITSPQTPLPGKIEELLKFPVSICFLLRQVLADTLHFQDRNLWSGNPPKMPCTTGFQSLPISPATTALFVAICRKNGVTIQSALQVLVAAVLFELVPSKFTKLNCVVPVCLRRWLPDSINDDTMGCWISSFQVSYTRQTFSWDEARRSRQKILEYIDHKGKNDTLALLRFVPDYKTFVTKMIGKQRTTSFELSNIGVLQTVQKGHDVKLGRMVFSQSMGIPWSAIGIGLVTVGDGSLVFGFSWQRECLERELVEKVAGLIKRKIQQLVYETV